MDKRHRGSDAIKDNSDPTVKEVIAKRREHIAATRSARSLFEKIVIIGAICYLVLTFIYGIGVVSGEGMYPRLRDGDLVIFYRLVSDWNIGEIVVYEADGQRQYGRIVAKGGDTVDMTDEGQLVVNGSIQQEEVFFATLKTDRNTTFPVTLNTDEIFVLGDNRLDTLDSRDFGPIPIKNIEGKVISLLRRRGL